MTVFLLANYSIYFTHRYSFDTTISLTVPSTLLGFFGTHGLSSPSVKFDPAGGWPDPWQLKNCKKSQIHDIASGTWKSTWHSRPVPTVLDPLITSQNWGLFMKILPFGDHFVGKGLTPHNYRSGWLKLPTMFVSFDILSKGKGRHDVVIVILCIDILCCGDKWANNQLPYSLAAVSAKISIQVDQEFDLISRSLFLGGSKFERILPGEKENNLQINLGGDVRS